MSPVTNLYALRKNGRSPERGGVARGARGLAGYATLERPRPGVDAARRAVQVLLALLLLTSPMAPASASPVPVRALTTLNWSGYALTGTSFTGVAGTFNVPVPMQSASCLEQTAIWVGIDGLSNGDLLQAGIAEASFGVASNTIHSDWPTPGTPRIVCWGHVEIYAWWEDLPSGAVRVPLPVDVGDRVTVALFKMSPGWWVLAIHDLSTKHSFLLSQPYDGPETSAEWVVEAPQPSGIGSGAIPFGTVHFADLSAQGSPGGLDRFSFDPKSQLELVANAVANPSQLLRAGFAVHFAG